MTSVCRSCAWTYSPVTRQNEGICYEENRARTELSVVTDLILSKEYQYKQKNDTVDNRNHNINETSRIIEYWCKPDWCTNESTVQQINKAIQNYYDLSSMHEALNINNGMTSEKTTISKTNSILTTKYTTTTISRTSMTTLDQVTTTKEVQNISSSFHISRNLMLLTVLMLALFNILL
jgi:hypothetical protein